MSKKIWQVCATIAAVGVSSTAAADVGGHVGVAVPMVSVTSNSTEMIGDFVTIAHPIGVTVKKGERLAIDFEVVVANRVDATSMTTLTVDPGVVYNWGPVATGLRVAFDISSTTNYGVVPLVNKGFDLGNGTAWFVEAAFPVAYDVSSKDVGITAVFHTGIGF